ncbi:hypothetical protein L207DRAFT_627605 [Hyaloscypha variabilis F]|uniref:BTB domain-containing protein n=1 Tax=Hyaloscypha variabilis (strain UAMH 11265 / GT02V1 / F) TaxID=1149755 RepID=A0A2J6SDX6_HYAVF|nr:hypothetical protein L207DRAFT_627605 [Hyaloscypha variabilis F]
MTILGILLSTLTVQAIIQTIQDYRQLISNALSSRTPQPVIAIVVDHGVNRQTFVIHKNLISRHSPFFNEALTSAADEIQSMTLEDVEAKIFGLFVHWLYTEAKKKSQIHSRPLIEWAKFYSLAHRFQVSKLADSLLLEVSWLDPSDDPHSGNTLQDFQSYAYGIHGNGLLKEQAVGKTMKVFLASKLKGIDEFITALPDGMLADFMKEMSQRWLRDRIELEEAQQKLEQYERAEH